MQKRGRPGADRRRYKIPTALLFFGFLASIVPNPAHSAASARPTRQFWVARSAGWQHLRLELIGQSAHVRLYVPAASAIPAWQANTLVTSFENKILPTDLHLFGSAAQLTPVDIALVPLDSTTLGYFDQNDVDPAATGGDRTHSNRANVLFARLPSAMPDRDKLGDTGEVIAHELQHLIEFRARVLQRHLPAQENWLNEGLSFYAQVANGFWTPRDAIKLQAACGSPSWPVTTFYRSLAFYRHDARIAYGRAGLFVTYLAGRFGPRLARDLVLSTDTGMVAVDAAVKSLDSRLSAESVFADWGVAQYLRQAGPYGYGQYARNLHVAPHSALPMVTAFPFDSQGLTTSAFSLRPWGQGYYQFATRGGQNLQIQIWAPPGALRVAAVLEDSARVSRPLARWFTARRDGSMVLRLDSLADLYDEITLVVSAVPAAGGPDAPVRFRVRATLINVSDNDRPTGLTAAPGARSDFSFPQTSTLGEPVSPR